MASKRSRPEAAVGEPSTEHQVARQRLSQSTSLHGAWQAPVGEQDMLVRQHSTTMRVDTWLPSSRLQRSEYTATVDKHAAKAQVAEWTPATAGRASAAASQQADTSAAVLQQHLSKLQVPPWAVEDSTAGALAKDPLVLSLEETAWLALHCKKLHVFNTRAAWCKHTLTADAVGPMSPQALAASFSSITPQWQGRTWLYCHLRQRNWVVRSGAAFAGEFVLYPDGPATGHAVYSLALAQAPGWGCTWREVLGRLRVASTVSKQLVIALLHPASLGCPAEPSAPPQRSDTVRGSSADSQAATAQPSSTAILACHTVSTVLFRGVRLDSEAGLKSRRHVRGIVSNWAKSLGGLASSMISIAGDKGSVHRTRITVLDCSEWEAVMEPGDAAACTLREFGNDWFQPAADWIGR